MLAEPSGFDDTSPGPGFHGNGFRRLGFWPQGHPETAALARHFRSGSGEAMYAKWIGGSVNWLLPVASIGGELVKARLSDPAPAVLVRNRQTTPRGRRTLANVRLTSLSPPKQGVFPEIPFFIYRREIFRPFPSGPAPSTPGI